MSGHDPSDAIGGGPSHDAAGARRVFPFFVGSGRSGTTLLRVIFDSHTQMAVPDESNFIPVLAARRAAYEGSRGFARDLFLEHLFAQRWVRRWGIGVHDVLESFESDPPADYAGAVRAVFAACARTRGKSRFADKTPRYVMDMGLISGLFPEARFVHVIRDGRDVALSFQDVDFGPSSVGEAALSWRERVATGRRTGSVLGPDRYREVFYEDLLEDVEGVVTSLCPFLDLAFEPEMLRYFERPDVVATSQTWKYRNASKPPTRMRDWRTEMTPDDVELFEALAGRALEAASYERRSPRPPLSARLRGAYVSLAARSRSSLRRSWRSLRSGAGGGTHAGPAPPFPMVSEPKRERSEVLSWLIARRADGDADVRSFRQQVLGGTLLSLDHVPSWIEGRARPDHGSSPDGAIDYIGPSGTARRPIATGGDLGRLASLGLEVARRYRWTAAEATSFVLTGLAPRVRAIRVSVDGGYPVGASTRIVMEVDPAADPREVIRRYRRLRRRLVPSRRPELDERSFALALMAADHPEADAGELHSLWNRTHPASAYDDGRRFQRDLALAQRRLLDPPW